MGLPGFMVYVIGALELVGGILLALGLFSRLASLFLAAIMIGAYCTAHKEALFGVFGNLDAFVKEAPFAYLWTTLTVFCFGPGCFSLDAWKKKKCCDEGSSSNSCCSTEKPSSHSSCCG
jgi:putative oxidoreductase